MNIALRSANLSRLASSSLSRGFLRTAAPPPYMNMASRPEFMFPIYFSASRAISAANIPASFSTACLDASCFLRLIGPGSEIRNSARAFLPSWGYPSSLSLSRHRSSTVPYPLLIVPEASGESLMSLLPSPGSVPLNTGKFTVPSPMSIPSTSVAYWKSLPVKPSFLRASGTNGSRSIPPFDIANCAAAPSATTLTSSNCTSTLTGLVKLWNVTRCVPFMNACEYPSLNALYSAIGSASTILAFACKVFCGSFPLDWM